MLEERTAGTDNAVVQCTWSPVYVNCMIERDRDADSSTANGLEERLYVLQDANWNVTALLSPSGTVLERFVYDPYGMRTVLAAATWASYTDIYAFGQGFQGGTLDTSTGLILFQRREYSPTLGRFLRQDPAGYVDGANLYQFVGSNPVNRQDPSGLQIAPPAPVPTAPLAGNVYINTQIQNYNTTVSGNYQGYSSPPVNGSPNQPFVDVIGIQFPNPAWRNAPKPPPGFVFGNGMYDPALGYPGPVLLPVSPTTPAPQPQLQPAAGGTGQQPPTSPPAPISQPSGGNPLYWAMLYHDAMADRVFGNGRGRSIGGRTYDKLYKGRDVEFKADNFRRPRCPEELDRINTQLTKDINNRDAGTANPHWHFLNDPSDVADMQDFLNRLEDAGIPWSFGAYPF